MRTVRQLLELMLDNQEYFVTGLCNWNRRLLSYGLINIDEFTLIDDYIDKYPTKIYLTTHSTYYWEVGKIHFRVRWLKKHIELLKQQE